MTSKPRVVVAMSGGVDSSVAAALLVQQGYDVIGMMMRLWSEDCGDEGHGESEHGSNRCCTPSQMDDARRIADQLGIPFYVIDTQDVFRRTIVQFFIDRYAAGDTPNPCIECNRSIRFEWLLNHALALGRGLSRHRALCACRAPARRARRGCSRGAIRPRIRVTCSVCSRRTNCAMRCSRWVTIPSPTCARWRRSLVCRSRIETRQPGFVLSGR